MLPDSIGAVIMVGGGGTTDQEQLVLRAQQASALDLIHLLQQQGLERIVVAAPDTAWIPAGTHVIHDVDVPSERFHFGTRLADLIVAHRLEPVLYFGGSSAPLLDESITDMLVSLLARSRQGGGIPSHIALTNNLHSSDWVAISHVDTALPLLRTCERDNSIAWLLKESGDYDVRVLAGVRPASSFDLDTPSDLALIARHGAVQPMLRAFLTEQERTLRAIPVDNVLDMLRVGMKTVAIIGRVSPLAWQALNKSSRSWTRVLGEERGMVASGRAEIGAVRSMLVPWIKARGADGFFSDLAEMADAVLFDDRVVFAAMDQHPDSADRFASDLFHLERIRNPWVKDFTTAALAAPLPVVLGGHSIVAGGLYVLAETLDQTRPA